MPRSGLLLLTIGSAAVWGSVVADAQEPRFRGPRGPFSVAAARDAFVLVEQNTGRTWLLAHSAEEHGGAVWLPIERVDNADEATEWRQQNQAIARERELRQREMAERRERDELHRHRQSAIIVELEALAHKQEQLHDRFGADHPEVRELAEHRERLDRELDEIATHQREREEVEHRRRQEQRHRHQDELRAHIGELADRLHELRDKFGAEHPEVREVQAEIQRLERELEEHAAHEREADHRDREEAERREQEEREADERREREREEREREDRDVDGRRRQSQQRRLEIRLNRASATQRVQSDSQRDLNERRNQLHEEKPRGIEIEIRIDGLEQLQDSVRERIQELLNDFGFDVNQRIARAREVDERRRQLEQRRREIGQEQTEKVRRLLIDQQREVAARLKEALERGAESVEIERLKSLKDTVHEKSEQIRREQLGADGDDEHETDDRDVRERRQQLEQRRRVRDEGSVERKESHSILHVHDHTVDQRLQAIEHRLHSLATQLDGANALIQATRQAVDSLATAIHQADEGRELTTDDEADVSGVAKEVFPLLLEEELLLQTRGPDHPEVKAVRRKIEITKQVLQKESGVGREQSEESHGGIEEDLGDPEGTADR